MMVCLLVPALFILRLMFNHHGSSPRNISLPPFRSFLHTSLLVNVETEFHGLLICNQDMYIQHVPHFINGLKCQLHDHGASCAVDALLELFYFGIYQFDRNLIHTCGDSQTLLSKLIDASISRDKFGRSCEIRQDVWTYLVQTLPEAYFPPGRRDAEILSAINELCHVNETLFQTNHRSILQCPSCQNVAYVNFKTKALHHLDSVLQANQGNLADLLEESLGQSVMHHVMHQTCRNCSDNMFLLNIENAVPDYLFVAIGLNHEARNIQEPSPIIPEYLQHSGSQYSLHGAIQMEPGHFLSICRLGHEFAMIDGCQHDVVVFPTFAAAVARCHDARREKQLSYVDRGVHVLLYCKDVALCSSSKVLVNPGMPQPCISLHQAVQPSNKIPATQSLGVSSHSPIEVQAIPGMPQHCISPNSAAAQSSNLSATTTSRSAPLVNQYTTNVEGNHSIEYDVCLPDSSMKYVLWQERVYISCVDAFKYLKLDAHISSRGYKGIYQALCRSGKETTAAFIFFKQSKSRWMCLESLLAVLEDKKFWRQHSVLKKVLHSPTIFWADLLVSRKGCLLPLLQCLCKSWKKHLQIQVLGVSGNRCLPPLLQCLCKSWKKHLQIQVLGVSGNRCLPPLLQCLCKFWKKHLQIQVLGVYGNRCLLPLLQCLCKSWKKHLQIQVLGVSGVSCPCSNVCASLGRNTSRSRSWEYPGTGVSCPCSNVCASLGRNTCRSRSWEYPGTGVSCPCSNVCASLGRNTSRSRSWEYPGTGVSCPCSNVCASLGINTCRSRSWEYPGTGVSYPCSNVCASLGRNTCRSRPW